MKFFFSVPGHLGEYDLLLPMPHFDRVLMKANGGVRVETAVNISVARMLIRRTKIVHRNKGLESVVEEPSTMPTSVMLSSQANESIEEAPANTFPHDAVTPVIPHPSSEPPIFPDGEEK